MGKYSRMLSNFFKMPYELGEEERKTQIKLLIPFGLIFYFVFSYCLFGLFIGLNFIPFFVSFNIILVGVVLILCFWDKLDKKYGFRPKRSPYQCSYQFYVVLLLFSMAPAIFIFGLFLGLEMGSFWFGFGFAFAAVFPICVMFLRIKTFSDRSIPVGGGFGFMPLSYWILSILIGLVVQSVVLFPDKLNKVVPLDLRTKNGFLFMFALALVLYGVSQFLIDFMKALISLVV